MIKHVKKAIISGATFTIYEVNGGNIFENQTTGSMVFVPTPPVSENLIIKSALVHLKNKRDVTNKLFDQNVHVTETDVKWFDGLIELLERA